MVASALADPHKAPGWSQLASQTSRPSAGNSIARPPEVGKHSGSSRSSPQVAPPEIVDYRRFLEDDTKGQEVLGSVVAKAIDVIIDLFDQNPSDLIVIPPQPPIPIDGRTGFPRPEKLEWRNALGLHRIQWAAVVKVTGTIKNPSFTGRLLIEAIPAVTAKGEAKFIPTGVVEIALDFSIEDVPPDKEHHEKRDRRYDLQASAGVGTA